MYQVTKTSTAFGSATPHGYNTPHKYPTAGTVTAFDVFNELAAQLYPTGRAWAMPEQSVLRKVHEAFNTSFLRLLTEAKNTLDGLFPFSDDFSEDDASLWEYRLGILVSPGVDLETRKLAILRKMAHPGNVKARQHRLFLEYQLQLAGFDVYVHQNGFYEAGELVYKTPDEVQNISVVAVQHGGDAQHGAIQHGSFGFEVIANKIDDEVYGAGGGNEWATFFIGGQTLGETANVPELRKREFRELVLKLKPAHLAAYLFINYN